MTDQVGLDTLRGRFVPFGAARSFRTAALRRQAEVARDIRGSGGSIPSSWTRAPSPGRRH